jgi:hypothetical protein
MMNILYSIATLIALVFLFMSYVKNVSSSILYPALIILTVRNITRLYDFEKSIDWYSNQERMRLVTLQMFCSFMLILILVKNFENIKWSIQINILMIIYLTYGVKLSNNEFDIESGNFIGVEIFSYLNIFISMTFFYQYMSEIKDNSN